MCKVNLFADVVPGKSAAGFELGLNIDAFYEIANIAASWDQTSCQVQEAIFGSLDWLHIPDNQLGVKGPAGSNYYYSRGAVMFHFSASGKLDMIVVGEGYKGVLLGDIHVGDKLEKILSHFEIVYDEAEELHFPDDESGISGVIIQGEEVSLDESPDQLISRVFIVPNEKAGFSF